MEVAGALGAAVVCRAPGWARVEGWGLWRGVEGPQPCRARSLPLAGAAEPQGQGQVPMVGAGPAALVSSPVTGDLFLKWEGPVAGLATRIIPVAGTETRPWPEMRPPPRDRLGAAGEWLRAAGCGGAGVGSSRASPRRSARPHFYSLVLPGPTEHGAAAPASDAHRGLRRVVPDPAHADHHLRLRGGDCGGPWGGATAPHGGSLGGVTVGSPGGVTAGVPGEGATAPMGGPRRGNCTMGVPREERPPGGPPEGVTVVESPGGVTALHRGAGPREG